MRWIVLMWLVALAFTSPILQAQDIFFQDDFEDGIDGWEVSAGTISAGNGTLIWDYEGEGAAIFTHEDFTALAQDFELAFDLTLTSADESWRLTSIYNTDDERSVYLGAIIGQRGQHFVFNENDEQLYQSERPPFALADGQTHRIRMMNTRDVLQLWVDETLLYAIPMDVAIDGQYLLVIGTNSRGVNTLHAEIDNFVVQSYVPVPVVAPADAAVYNETLAVTVPGDGRLSVPFVVHADDVVDFVFVDDTLVYSIFMPDGSLWTREYRDLINTILPVSGVWTLEFNNTQDDNPADIQMLIRLVSTSAESIGSDGLSFLTAADLSGRYLTPLLRRIYISPISNLALLHKTTFLLGERADGTIILSEDQATLDAALAHPGFIDDPAFPLRYIWLYDGTSGLRAIPQEIFTEHFGHFAGTELGEVEDTVFGERNWYFWRFNGTPDDYRSFDRRTFVIPLDDGGYAVGYETDGTSRERSEFDTIDIVDTVEQGFPYLTDEQRADLGLPLSVVDAPTIEVDVDLPQTHSTDLFTFDYPAEDWRVSASTDANIVTGIVGLPAILVYEPDGADPVQIAFFVPTAGTFFDVGTWMDIMNLAGAQMLDLGGTYTVEQVYINDNLMSIVDTQSELSGHTLRIEVRLSNAQTVTMLLSGVNLDVLDRDTLLAIAGSLRP